MTPIIPHNFPCPFLCLRKRQSKDFITTIQQTQFSSQCSFSKILIRQNPSCQALKAATNNFYFEYNKYS